MTSSTAPLHSGHAPARTDRLPLAALLVMALMGFLLIATETMPAGLRPQIATGPAISEGTAGQLVSLDASAGEPSQLGWTVVFEGYGRRGPQRTENRRRQAERSEAPIAIAADSAAARRPRRHRDQTDLSPASPEAALGDLA